MALPASCLPAKMPAAAGLCRGLSTGAAVLAAGHPLRLPPAALVSRLAGTAVSGEMASFGLAPRRQSAVHVMASVSVPLEADSRAAAAPLFEVPKKTAMPWQWQAKGSGPISIRAVSYEQPGAEAKPGEGHAVPTVLMLPALSDVSQLEEWDALVSNLLLGSSAALAPSLSQSLQERSGQPAGSPQPLRVVALDWPGFGRSGSPPLEYTAELLEDFLVDYVAHLFPGEPKKRLPLLIVGGGHAATIALRAVGSRINPVALAAIAPTWGGPLPIVFGNDEKMTARYNLLRAVLQSPGIGWAAYRYLFTSEKSIKMQYMTHVYADPNNITPEMVQQRTAITRREGARFAPSSFISGLLDPVKTREDFLGLFKAAGERGVPVGVLASDKSPKRSKREMESLNGAQGVSLYEVVPGALLPWEEYPAQTAKALERFLQTCVLN